MRQGYSFNKNATDLKSLKQYKKIMEIETLLSELEKCQENYKSEEILALDSRNLLEKENQILKSLKEYQSASVDFKEKHGEDKLHNYQNSGLFYISWTEEANSKLAKDLLYYNDFCKSHIDHIDTSEQILEATKEKVNTLTNKVDNLLKEQPLNETIADRAKNIDECCICMCPYDTENHKHSCITSCGHRFGRSCLASLKRCPICLKRFKSKNVITLY